MFQKIGAADLIGVPAREIETSAVASNLEAFGPITSVPAPGNKVLSIDLDGQDDSEESDREMHCRGSRLEDLVDSGPAIDSPLNLYPKNQQMRINGQIRVVVRPRDVASCEHAPFSLNIWNGHHECT